MKKPTHITVTARPGLRAPVHPGDGQEPGGGLLCVEHGSIVRVRLSQATRRAIARGDLVPCNMDGAEVGVELADAPADLPGGRILLPRKEATK